MPSVAILGLGVVGSGVAQMLADNASLIERAAGRSIKLKYVLEIREVALPEGASRAASMDEILADPDVAAVAETIGGTRIAYELTKKALAAGRHVVTSNKELVAARGDELMALAAQMGVSYRFEAAVGGGIPALSPMRDCLSHNRISRVDGIVNGSTNYLITRMAEKGVNFPAALGEAKALGYVEGNPEADVEGHDARRKLAILARTAFGAPLSGDQNIPTVGISSLTVRDLRAANLFGGAVKLVAHARLSLESWSGWVHPAFVPAASPLYGVRDVFNGRLVRGDFVGDVMFYGRGAGSRPTASAVVSDMVSALHSNCGAPPLCAGPDFKDDPEELLSAVVRVEKKGELMHGCEYREEDGLVAARTPLLPRREIDRLPGVPLYALPQD